MSDLRRPMNPLTFDQLVSLGRSIIPTVAPTWSDHNVHDPGIMLIDLVSWISEAQMYALSRVRKDERIAYARLLGVIPRGPQEATGLVWPFAGEGSAGPAPTWTEGVAIAAGTPVASDRMNAPAFVTQYAVALTTARVVKVESRFADSTVRDWTTSNSRDGATFLPFGASPAPDDRLVITIEMKSSDLAAFTSPLSLGFEIVNAGERPQDGLVARRRTRLVATLDDGSQTRPVRIVNDTTDGLLKSGVLVLDVDVASMIDSSAPADTPVRFAMTFGSATGGFLRPPRVQRLGVNVLAVTQTAVAVDEKTTFGKAQPDQTHTLDQPGLMFPIPVGTFKVEVTESDAFKEWTQVDDLSLSVPGDRHYELEWQKGELRFGNGINGAIPELGATLRVTYRVSGGTRGNLPAGARWLVSGVAGDFGMNSEAMTGGSNALGLGDLRGLARSRSQMSRPLVTSIDLEQAALSFKDLGISRAHEFTQHNCPTIRGTRTLIIVGVHDPKATEVVSSEGEDLLEEVHSRLAPRLPLGQRLEVIAPHYIPLRVVATLTAARNVNPREVETDARKELLEELAIVAIDPEDQWPFGRNVTEVAVKGWLRSVKGVARVVSVTLLVGDDEMSQRTLIAGPRDLPQYRYQAGDLTVEVAPLPRNTR
jgi:predicted phage baseplate assembly protein